jgi:type II secretory pathway pseudopilin PulG
MSAVNRGFSLLEVTLALGIGGLMLGGMWQIMGATTQSRDASALAGQATAVSAAAQQYINSQRSYLLALPGLASLNSAVRVRIIDTDTGATANSVQGAGFLPSSFVNQNSFGQSFALFVRREDGGTMGVADANDRLVGLLITTGGTAVSDQAGGRAASAMGAPGGFMYAENNPANPTAATNARGAFGAWQVDLTTAGWSGIGALAQAGRFALLTNMTPPSTSGSGGSGGSTVTAINDLTDAATDYSSLFNLYMGENAGQMNVLGTNNTGVGINALQRAVPGTATSSNTAFGFHALRGWSGPFGTGTNNVAIGAQALENFTTASRVIAIGSRAERQNQSASDRVSVGFMAGETCGGSDTTFIGSWAGACTSGGLDATGSTIVGAHSGRWVTGQYNTLLGAYIGWQNAQTGDFNTAAGYQALHNVLATGDHNTVLGYQAGDNITSGTYNIIIGSGVDAPIATGSNQINIGNLIHGNILNGQVEIGDPTFTLTPGISFDVGARTDSARLPVGTDAQRPACTASLIGAQRWSTTSNALEYCNGSTWVSAAMTSGSGPPPTLPTSVGYFVMTNGTWDGNLGGFSGANSRCLSDLTANDWRGKATAVANGLLTAANVRAFICAGASGYSGACNNAVPLGTYLFARSGSTTAGGASFMANASGFGPQNEISWSSANYFGSGQEFWSNRTSTSNAMWADGHQAWASIGGGACSNFTSNSAADFAGYGNPASPTAARWGSGWYGGGRNCNQSLALVCFVHPGP